MRASAMVGLSLGGILVSMGVSLGACASDSDKQAIHTADSATQPAAAGSRNAAAASDGGTVADAGGDAGRDAGPPDAGSDAAAAGASQSADTPGVKCTVVAPTACVEPKPVYADVSPILQARCVMCHNGQAGGPWPLTSYGHVADWQNEIRDNVSKCFMPPVDANVPMTVAERDKILMWIRCGVQP